jgi:hypothetical protein
LVLSAVLLFHVQHAVSQDTIYYRVTHKMVAQVKSVNSKYVYFARKDNVQGRYRCRKIDSIVYAGGRVEVFPGNKLHTQIPQLNSVSIDPVANWFSCIALSYERRLARGWLGLRIPLYFDYYGGGIAGYGAFDPGYGIFYPQSYYTNVNTGKKGSACLSICTGINPKLYLVRRRRVLPFVGPEITLGYAVTPSYLHDCESSFGTVAFLGKFGLTFNPVDKMNLSLEGGAGAGTFIGQAKPFGWIGAWQLGLLMGFNF